MRFYYGWWIVAIAMLVMFLTIGATMQSFGMFVLPVSEDFGLSRADANTGVILVNLGVAVVSPFVGRALDTYPIRRIMAIGAVLFGVSLVALGLSHNLVLSAFILAVPLALGIAASGTLTSMSLVARWFQAQRGRAMALAVMGMSMGTIVMAPVAGWLIENFGWRYCLILFGIVIGAIFLALVPFVRPEPGEGDVEPRPAGAVEDQAAPPAHAVGKPLKTFELIRLPQFWILAVSAAMTFGAMQAMMVSIVPIAQEAGVSVTQSATLLSAVGALAILGKLALVWMGDRLDRNLLLAGLFVAVAMSSAALIFGTNYPTLLFCSALLGLAAGATMPVFLALLADRVGAASFGTANGVASLMMALIGAAAVRYGGEVYDRTGSYKVMFLTFLAVGLVSAVLTLVSGRFGKAGGEQAVA